MAKKYCNVQVIYLIYGLLLRVIGVGRKRLETPRRAEDKGEIMLAVLP